MRILRISTGILLCCVLVVTAWGCSKSTWQQIGDDTRKAAETTGQAIEGATKGAIDAVEKK